jgi:hypothetical protein
MQHHNQIHSYQYHVCHDTQAIETKPPRALGKSSTKMELALSERLLGILRGGKSVSFKDREEVGSSTPPAKCVQTIFSGGARDVTTGEGGGAAAFF